METNVVFDDPLAVAELQQIVEALKAECRPVGLAEARRYRTPDYSLRWLWMQIGG